MKPLLILLFLLPFTGFAQVWDDFSDGNFTQNPSWSGDIDRFEVNEDFQLQLKSDGEGTSHLATVFGIGQETEWRFYIRCAFSPSSNNNARFYLAASDLNLENPQTGYFLQFGESGSDDAIELFRQNGETETSICRGTDGLISSSFELWMRIRKDAQGNWTLEADPTGNGAYMVEATGNDNSLNNSSFLGVVCNYTSSNAENFYFDDVYAGQFDIDTEPPELQQISVTSENSLNLMFNETILEATAINIQNYNVSNQIGNPITASLNNENPAMIHLVFGQNFPNGEFISISIVNLTDLAGNEIVPVEESFVYFMPAAFDIQINEIMADPNPPVGLPDEEYLELYNTTGFPVNLEGWKLLNGNNDLDFENVSIQPGGFLIIGDEDAESDLEIFGDFYGFSSFSLNNSGQTLVLLNPYTEIISTIIYDNSWYGDPEKDNGGWSIEQIDPGNPCGGISNWTASIHPDGGTPGSENAVNDENPDTQPPFPKRIEFESERMLILHFSEPMESSPLFDNTAYQVDNGIGIPDSALPAWPAYQEVRLVFPESFQESVLYTLSITNPDFADCAGNTIDQTEITFSNYSPNAREILINEIMADPTPAVGLPEWEFVELYNSTAYPVDLAGWKLIVGTTEKIFESITINAGSYLILGDESAESDFIFSGDFYGFSSFALTNNGQILILENTDGVVISTVEYALDWYRDANKEEGGWSLEQIDPANPCGGKSNWMAASNTTGGTPGQLNSVDNENPDILPPYPERVEYENENTIMLHFSEPIDKTFLDDTTNYEVDHAVGNPFLAQPQAPDFSSVVLFFDADFEYSVIYSLQINNENLADCAGNLIDVNKVVSFGLPEEVEESDIVINEVLFNPSDQYVDGVDFVEIVNRSQKIFDLNDLLLCTEDEDTGELDASKEVSTDGYLFFPGEYLVLTTKPDVVKTQYFTENPDGFIRMESLPSYSNDKGVVLLATKGFVRIDRMAYSEDMQYPLLNSFDGVSLERINFDRPTDDLTNWHSAAESAGFATPGDLNSQFSMSIETNDPITIEPEVFSPDNDGRDDVLNINYKFATSGKNCSVNIYDSRGRPVRTLVNNEFIGTEGQFSWDGLNDDNQKAPIGIYVIFVEVFDTEGNTENYKKTAVLGTRF